MDTPEPATRPEITRAKAALAAEKKKRRSRPALVILLSLLLFAVGAAAGIALYIAYFQPVKEPIEAKTVQETAPIKTSTNAETVITEVTSKLQGTVVATKLDDTTSNGQTTELKPGTLTYQTPPVIPKGAKFFTMPTIAYGVTTATQDDARSLKELETAHRLLIEKNFTPVGISSDTSNGLIYSERMQNDTTVCILDSTSRAYGTGYQFSIGCADFASYDITAKALQPFYTLLTSQAELKDLNDNPYLRLSKPIIKDSQTSGYKTATVSVGSLVGTGYATLFYQAPDGQWHFFKATQGVLPCADYSTDDLKKAYKGEQCGNTGRVDL